MTGPEVQDIDEGAVEGLILTAYLDASGVQAPGSVQIIFEAGFFKEDPPDEVKGMVDEVAQICSDIVGERIGPVVQTIATETRMVPGDKVEIFSLDFRYTNDHGRCVWKIRPALNPRLIEIKEGLIVSIAEECAERCTPVIAGRFTECAMVQNWTVG